MSIMLFLLSLISFLTLVSGSPAMHARRTTFAPIPIATPTACPASGSVTATWIPAATNVAAIPKGLLTECQLNCLADTASTDSNCDQATEYWTYCFHQPNATDIGECLCNPPIYYEVIFQDCAGCLATAQYLANLAHRPKHPASDFFNTTSGLVAQLTNAYENFCNTNPADAPVELEHFLCESRDITARFGGPIAMMNFTLLSRPQLAWNGYGSAPSGLGLAGLPLLATSTSRRWLSEGLSSVTHPTHHPLSQRSAQPSVQTLIEALGSASFWLLVTVGGLTVLLNILHLALAAGCLCRFLVVVWV